MNRKSTRLLAAALAVLILLIGTAVFASAPRVAPDNPIEDNTERLQTETLSDNRATEGLNSDGSGGDKQGGPGDGRDSEAQSGDRDEPEDTEDEPVQKPENENPVPDTLPGTAQSEAKDGEGKAPPTPGGGAPVQSETGPGGSNQPGTGEEPSGPGENGEPGGEQPVEGIVTDLKSCVITVPELDENVLNFYVYYSDPAHNAKIKVNCRHESDHGNGVFLKPNGRNYSAGLSLGLNYILVRYTDKDGIRKTLQYNITYAAQKADEEHPEVGKNPPEITTNLDSWSGNIDVDQFTFQVSARDYNGNTIYSNHITVTLDGVSVINPTGIGSYEYMLYFKPPNVGYTRDYTVGVLAWDDEGNSRYKTFAVTYFHKGEGIPIGDVTVVFDATTVGMGIFEAPIGVELLKGENAAKVLVKALEYYGYSYECNGTLDVGFYLSRIMRYDSFPDKVLIPEKLQNIIRRDGIDMWLDEFSRDSLGEYDYTRGSGWAYAINGYYPGKAMNEYFPNPGDTLTVRYTLAYGKDIGSPISGNGLGQFTSYCTIWRDNSEILLSHFYSEKTRVEPTCTEDGYIEYECRVCGETYRDVLPATGHSWNETDRLEPTETEDGYIEYTCAVCGDKYRQILPAKGRSEKKTAMRFLRRKTRVCVN